MTPSHRRRRNRRARVRAYWVFWALIAIASLYVVVRA